MAKKTVQAKPGDTVRLRIRKRRKGKPQVRAIDDRRYGPPPPLDETRILRRARADLIAHFLDQSTAMRVSSNGHDATHNTFPYRELRWVQDTNSGTQFPGAGRNPNMFGFIDATGPRLTATTEVRRYTTTSSTPNTLYRFSWDCWPLPKQADPWGVSLILDGTTFPLANGTPEWVERASPTERREELEAIQAETGEDLSAQIALLELEEDEWAADFYSPETYWSTLFQTYTKNYAYLQKRMGNRREAEFSVITSQPYFEPFNPFDTVNYKFTEDLDFTDPEVPAPKIPKLRQSGQHNLKIGIFPRYWAFELSAKAWYQAHVALPSKAIVEHEFTVSGGMYAPTSPMSWWRDFNFIKPVPGGAIDQWDFNKFEQYSSQPGQTPHPSNPSGFPSLDAMFFTTYSGMIGNDDYIQYHGSIPVEIAINTYLNNWKTTVLNPLYPFGSVLLEVSDCSAVITDGPTPTGNLVGTYSHDGGGGRVWRKTDGPVGATVFSGGFTGRRGGPPATSAASSGFDNWWNQFPNALPRAFSDFEVPGHAHVVL